MLGRGEYSEKRDFGRMGVECGMTFQVEGKDETHNGIARNLSASGLLITTDREVPVGTLLYVCIKPEKAIVPPLEASVEVLRVESPVAGSYELGVSIKEIKSSTS